MLAFELLAKKHRSWTLHFVSNARAETDAPDNLLELIKQVSLPGAKAVPVMFRSH